MTAWTDSVSAFRDAGTWLVSMTAEVGERWAAPGLGEWDVRSLVGHACRSFLTVETYLAQPPEAVEVHSPADYYLATREIAAGPGVAVRGVEAGRALGADPAAAVADIADRVLARVGSCSGEEQLTTIAGGMRLADYLPTRTFELTVHTCDLAAALGVPARVPASAAAETLAVIGAVAAADGRADEVLLALTGRRPLRQDFSVL